ncbi:CopD family protein [Paucibacter sp. DJ2R-2]|uniref:CopD family protein n=1 Tax=Paucibacter sp. DJ2R-2 TaxID=2893558 RepID=UPI0021E3932D|nr:CopD family protein [Paucibacter sp. DJ2R-2]MCV2419593.1 CopD family protein [Paucibacter sp. DJ4R-1]MCV2437504.1 CopD family protein [Paucibacter sp. DJ2R-2]
MIYATLKTLHVLSIIVWIGGMVFAHFFLRPAVAQLEAPLRLRLMHDVLGRFFQAVLVASLLTLASGVWMLGRVAKQVVQSGGNFEMPLAWTVMAVLGVVMVAIFMHIRFALYKRFSRAVAVSEWAAAGAALAQIRTWVSVNLGLGVLVVLVTLMRWST